MSARALRALACLVLGGRAAAIERRRLGDEEVLASQRGFSLAWRDSFNKGDAQYCGSAYLDDASLHAALGPAAADLRRLLGVADPALLRGRGAITGFWNRSMAAAGLRDLRAYEASGEYASTAFVLDDDTVIVEGRFVFAGAVRGQVLSELWVRSGEEWKMRSQMLAIQAVSGGFKFGPAARPPGGKKGAGAAAAKPKPAARAAPAKPASNTAGARGPLRPKPASAGAAGNSTEAAAAPSGGGGGGTLVLLLAVILTCGAGAFFLRRSRRRHEAAVAGFEAMLG